MKKKNKFYRLQLIQCSYLVYPRRICLNCPLGKMSMAAVTPNYIHLTDKYYDLPTRQYPRATGVVCREALCDALVPVLGELVPDSS